MLINKFTKKKNGMYNILLEDGSSLLAHEDIILKYGLLLKKNITDEEKENIEEENLIYISYDLAIKYISVKMRTRKEIKEYLEKKSVNKDIIDNTIEMLENSKYIDDISYASSFVNDKINLSNDGPNKIVRELIEKGVKEELALRAVKYFSEDKMLEKIKKLSEKISNTNRNKSTYALRNKIIEYLSNLGYDKPLIFKEIDNLQFNDDSEIAKKEYEKIYRKLSRKYSGKELEYKVKQKMYSLGFKNYNYDME